MIESIFSGKTSVSIWNGGMSDVLITTADGDSVNRVASSGDVLNCDMEILTLDSTSRLHIMSDGLLDRRNQSVIKLLSGLSLYDWCFFIIISSIFFLFSRY